MKRIAILILFILAAAPAWAQNPVVPWITRPNLTFPQQWDSIYVTDRAFHRIGIMVFNHSYTDTIKIARENDTTSVRNIVNVPPKMSVNLVWTNAKHIRTKATAAGVKGELIVNEGTYGASIAGDVQEVLDTLSSRFPASKPRELADTLTRPATGAQAYTAGQAISTSKSAPVIQGWADAMLTAGGSARLVYIKTVADSIANGASIRYDFFSDSIAVNNDGATQTMDVSHAAKWLGFAVVTLRSSTGSTMSWGSTEFTGTEVRSSTRKVWYRMSAENSFTLPLGGKIRSWVKFVYD